MHWSRKDAKGAKKYTDLALRSLRLYVESIKGFTSKFYNFNPWLSPFKIKFLPWWP